jgi:GTP-binding protein
LEKRKALNGLVLLVDIRRSLGEYDLQMIEYATHLNLDVFVALTKADKLNRNGAKNTLFAVQKLLKDSPANIQVELFSSLKKEGIEPLHNWLDAHLGIS